MKEVTLADDVKVEELAEKCGGYSGADIANVCRDASMMSVRRYVQAVSCIVVYMMNTYTYAMYTISSYTYILYMLYMYVLYYTNNMHHTICYIYAQTVMSL